MNFTDTQLIEQFVKEADQTAFEQLVERYINVAYSAAISHLGREDLARDACQLTFSTKNKTDGLGKESALGFKHRVRSCW